MVASLGLVIWTFKGLFELLYLRFDDFVELGEAESEGVDHFKFLFDFVFFLRFTTNDELW